LSTFLSLIIAGAVSGAIYSLLAAGLTLSYSASGVFNFAQGATAFVVALLYFELNTGLHWPVWAAAIFSIFVFAPLFGLFLDFLVFRPLMSANETARILAPVGLLVALPALALWLVERAISFMHWNIPSPDNIFLPSGIGPSPAHYYRIAAGVSLNSNQVIVLIVAGIVSVALWLALRHTSVGLRIRATVNSRELAALRGVSPARSSAIAWTAGICLAGLAGVIGAPVLNSLSPVTFTLIMFASTTAAVAGRLRSIPIAFAGGLILGVLQNLVAGYAGFARGIAGFSASVPVLLLLLVLVVLGRDRIRVAGSVNTDVASPDYFADIPPWRRFLPWTIAIAFLVVYLLWIGNPYWIGVVTEGLAFGLVFLSFVVVTGLGGMVSLSQAAFVTLAGLTAGVLIHDGWPFWPALLVGVAVTTAAGVLVALPALRVGGLFLALATLALALFGDDVLFAWQKLGGPQLSGWKIPRPSIGPLHLASNRAFAMFLLVLIGLITLLVHSLRQSASGRAIVTVRSSEAAAATMGISSPRVKLTIFALSAAIAGFSGVLLASYSGGASGSAFTSSVGLVWLASVVLFGVRRPAGAVVAGLVSTIMPAIFTSGIHWPLLPSFLDWNGTQTAWLTQILFGAGAIQMARYPDGAIALVSAQNLARRQRRRQRRSAVARGPEVAVLEMQGVPHVSVLEGAREDAVLTDTVGAVSLVNVHAGYDGVAVLHAVNLVVPPGSVTTLLGANGAGKSTLCKVISGQVMPTSGSVFLGTEDITALPPFKRARRNLLLAPESRGVFTGLTVEENLSLVLPNAADRALVYDRFRILDERRSFPAANLSGGEQQMLTLAPLLVHPPEVLVADEPTLGLAPFVIADLLQVLREIAERGTSILLVEERARDVLTISDRVAILSMGQIAWSGEGRDVEPDVLTDAYLGGRG
jgi:ABC-type branched-subunit amino acid transport system ATPase component/branched-subunit amino acid ABC-type transport system permease component